MGTQASALAPRTGQGRRPMPVCTALHCTSKLHGEEQRTAGLCLRHIQSGAPQRKPSGNGALTVAHPTKPGYVRISEGALDQWWHSFTAPSKAAIFQSALEDIELGRYQQ